RKLLGAMLAMCALAVLVSAATGNVTVNGVILIMIAACSWTLMGVIVKASKTTQAFAFNVWGMLFAPVPLVLFAVMLHGDQIIWQGIEQWDWNTTIAVLFQAYP
ncbi:EamA family transporter, partial [Vibrio breoganii]